MNLELSTEIYISGTIDLWNYVVQCRDCICSVYQYDDEKVDFYLFTTVDMQEPIRAVCLLPPGISAGISVAIVLRRSVRIYTLSSESSSFTERDSPLIQKVGASCCLTLIPDISCILLACQEEIVTIPLDRSHVLERSRHVLRGGSAYKSIKREPYSICSIMDVSSSTLPSPAVVVIVKSKS